MDNMGHTVLSWNMFSPMPKTSELHFVPIIHADEKHWARQVGNGTFRIHACVLLPMPAVCWFIPREAPIWGLPVVVPFWCAGIVMMLGLALRHLRLHQWLDGKDGKGGIISFKLKSWKWCKNIKLFHVRFRFANVQHVFCHLLRVFVQSDPFLLASV